MLSLPEGLPLPVGDDYGFKPVSPIVRTTMASGRAMQRRRFGSVPTLLPVTWLLSSEEAKMFEGWCKLSIGWVDWFLCPIMTPMGLNPTRARFTDIYEGPKFVGEDLWRYTATLELFELPIVDEAALTELLLGMPLPVMNAALNAELRRWYTKSWPGSQLG